MGKSNLFDESFYFNLGNVGICLMWTLSIATQSLLQDEDHGVGAKPKAMTPRLLSCEKKDQASNFYSFQKYQCHLYWKKVTNPHLRIENFYNRIGSYPCRTPNNSWQSICIYVLGIYEFLIIFILSIIHKVLWMLLKEMFTIGKANLQPYSSNVGVICLVDALINFMQWLIQ